MLRLQQFQILNQNKGNVYFVCLGALAAAFVSLLQLFGANFPSKRSSTLSQTWQWIGSELLLTRQIALRELPLYKLSIQIFILQLHWPWGNNIIVLSSLSSSETQKCLGVKPPFCADSGGLKFLFNLSMARDFSPQFRPGNYGIT